MSSVSYENIGIWLNNGDKFWSSTDRQELCLTADDLMKQSNLHNFYANANEYIKEVKKPKEVRLRIEDLKEDLKMKQEALPWEE